MKHKLMLAAALAAVAGGVAVSTAEAAPASGNLLSAKAADAIVEKAHYGYRRPGPWWWNSRRYDNDYRWQKKPWWWKHNRGRDWSSRDDRHGRDHDRRRRDW